jgi:hypothetical protein
MLKLDTGGRLDMGLGRGSRPPEELRFAIELRAGGRWIRTSGSARLCQYPGGLQPGLCPCPERACVADRVGRHHATREEAARRRRRGIQAGRGDLREIPQFADLRDIGERPDGGLIVRIHLPPARSLLRTAIEAMSATFHGHEAAPGPVGRRGCLIGDGRAAYLNLSSDQSPLCRLASLAASTIPNGVSRTYSTMTCPYIQGCGVQM